MHVLRAALAATTILAGSAGHAAAQDEDLAGRIARLEALVARQQAQIEAQEAELLATRRAVDERWRVLPEPALALDTARGGQAFAAAPASADGLSPPLEIPQEPAPQTAPPALSAERSELAALPEGMSVLNRPGRFTFDVSTDYTRSSSNRLVFRGIEIVPGIQIGVIEANEADRDTLGATVAGRLGLTDRLELEARVPYVRRSDTVTTVQQRDEAVTRTIELEGDGIGDIEGAVRYQFTRGVNGRPILVGALRVKSDTGEGPFDIPRDEFGVATRLATGSGFWGVEPSLSLLYPSDPAVIFANVSYFAHLPRDVDMVEGDVRVGRVDPGDSIGLALGFGFALNRRFSYSLGYKHNYIFPTESELNDAVERSDELQVGSLLFGMSFRFSDRLTLNGNFEFGVTEDAPDMRFVLRVPLTF